MMHAPQPTPEELLDKIRAMPPEERLKFFLRLAESEGEMAEAFREAMRKRLRLPNQ